MQRDPEIFIPVIDFPELYHISNHGRIKALAKWVDIGNNRRQFYLEKIMACPISSSGYRCGAFCKNGVAKQFSVHVETAKHFCENSEGKPVVNHENGNKLDNYFGNLKWATSAENNQHAYDTGLKIGAWTGKFGRDHHRSLPVIQLDLNGSPIREWQSQHLASKALGIRQSGISQAASHFENGWRCGGFLWKTKMIANG